jgi:hypothetical protein
VRSTLQPDVSAKATGAWMSTDTGSWPILYVPTTHWLYIDGYILECFSPSIILLVTATVPRTFSFRVLQFAELLEIQSHRHNIGLLKNASIP